MSNDQLVKCCRCRNKHLESERIWKSVKRYGLSCRDLVCPRCSCTTYYKLADQKGQSYES